MDLFFLECKRILKSYIYYVFIGAVILFYASQMGFTDMKAVSEYSSPPEKVNIQKYYEKNHRYPYGEKATSISIQTITNVSQNLYFEYEENRYSTYPLGVIKIVRLKGDDKIKVRKILEEVTGKSIRELSLMYDKNQKFPVDSNMNINKFNELMVKVDSILGGGSSYNSKDMLRFTRVPVTYEEALKEHEYLVSKDKLTQGYARLFCDYIGIVMGILPIFIVVFMCLADKRSKMQELLYFRDISSAKLILSRFFALVFMMILPVFLISIEPLSVFIKFSLMKNISIDAFAFVKYIMWWILPTLMFVIAIGMLLTTFTNTVIALAFQVFIWFFSLITTDLAGEYPTFALIIRHNDSGLGEVVRNNQNLININRLVIIGMAFIMLLLTIYVYEQKRRGRFDFNSKMPKLFKLGKNKSKA